MIYYFVFLAIALVFVMLLEINRNNKRATILLMLGLFLFSSLFVGLRSNSVGYDTNHYVRPIYERLEAGQSVQEIKEHTNTEDAYVILMGILHSTMKDYHLILIVLAMLGSVGYFVFAYYFRQKIPLKYSLLIYLSLYWIYEFNTIRQCIALSLEFIAICCMYGFLLTKDKKRLVGTVVLVISSIAFHVSAIVLLIAAIICLLFAHKNKTKNGAVLILTAIMYASIAIVVFVLPLISLAGQTGILSERYANYASYDSADFHEEISFDKYQLIIKIVGLAIALLCIKKHKSKWLSLATYFLVIDLIYFFMTFHLRNTYRLTWYVYYPSIIVVVAKFPKMLKKDRTSIMLYDAAVYALFLAFFVIKIASKAYGLVPYELGI